MERITPNFIISLSAAILFAVAPFVVHGQLALIVANIRVSALDSTATISWSTNIPSTGRVEYGLTSAHGSTVGYEGEQRSSHQVTLNGLRGETTYHFRVISSSPGQETASFDQTFKTTKAVDRDAPGLTDVAVPYQGGTEVLVQWRTDEATDSLVEYGLTSNYGSKKQDGARVTVHEMLITGLKPLTTYHFRVKSKDSGGNTAVSEGLSFRTTSAANRPVLELTAIRPVSGNDPGLADTSAEISWRSTTLANGVVRWGPTDKLGRTITISGPRDYTHTAQITGLQPNTTYYFSVESKDLFSANAKTTALSFVTRDRAGTPAAYDNSGRVLGVTSRHDLMFYASYDQGLHGDFSLGDPLGIALGVPSVTENSGGRRSEGVTLTDVTRVQYDGRDNANPSAGTIAFWFKPNWDNSDDIHHQLFTNNAAYQQVNDKYLTIGKTGAKGIANVYLNEKNKLYFGLEDADDVDYRYFVQNAAPAAGQWMFMTVSWDFDGGAGKVYVNGEPAQTHAYRGLKREAATLSATPAGLLDAFLVGGTQNASFGIVNGDITLDELTIFGRALTDSEIKLLYTEGVGRWLPKSGPTTVTIAPSYPSSGQVLGSSNLLYTQASALLRVAGTPDVYAILNGQKHLIAGPASFAAYGYQWPDVREVSQATLDRYPDARLVRTPADPQIHYLYKRPQERWLKLGLPSPTVFVSYPGNYWGNVVVINEIDMESYPQVRLVKVDGETDVYLLDNGVKRRIADPAAYDALSLPRSHVVNVSRVHLDYYPMGDEVR